MRLNTEMMEKLKKIEEAQNTASLAAEQAQEADVPSDEEIACLKKFASLPLEEALAVIKPTVKTASFLEAITEESEVDGGVETEE